MTQLVYLIPVLGFSFFLSAQKAKKINILNSEVTIKDPTKYDGNTFLTGKVHLEHDGAHLFADTIVLYEKENVVKANSNVTLYLGDSVQLSCYQIRYNGITRKATAFDKVILRDKTQTLETDELEYDRNTNKAYYNDWGKITDAQNVLKSKKGIYHVRERRNEFLSSVKLVNKDYTVDSDNMEFLNNEQRANFYGPTIIRDTKNPKSFIVTEQGHYYTKRKEAFLEKNSKVYYEDKILSGDKLYFNQITGFGKGEGNVRLQDPKEKRELRGSYGEVFQFKDSAMITGRPHGRKFFEKDTLHFTADTLIAKRTEDKTSKIFAYHKVRFFKPDLRGKSDSLFLNESLGEMFLYKKPIIWSGNQQITSDTVRVFFHPKKQSVDSIFFYQNAFAIAQVDSLNTKEFNQSKGKKLIARFENGDIYQVDIIGNAQSLSYIDEEDSKTKKKSRIGINQSFCGTIRVDFEERKARFISCNLNGDSKLYPESKIPLNARFLSDFNWRIKERPEKWQDIFDDYVGKSEDLKKVQEEVIDLKSRKNTDKKKKSAGKKK